MRNIIATRCSLEPQVVVHADEMFVVLSDTAIYEFESAPPTSQAWLTERFARLESRASVGGAERWLNWVIRVPGGDLAGYVQATVQSDGIAYVAYVLASRFWRRGIGRDAVTAMLRELTTQYDVHMFLAVLKASNYRSLALLNNLGFLPGYPATVSNVSLDQNELVMHRQVSDQARTA